MKYDMGGLVNRPFSKVVAENSDRLMLKTYTSTRKNTFTLVTLTSFSTLDVIHQLRKRQVCFAGCRLHVAG